MSSKLELDASSGVRDPRPRQTAELRAPLRIGELLTSMGLVSEAQLAQALLVQQQFGGRLGSNLVELGIVTEEQIARCLAEHYGLPYCGANMVANVGPEVVALLPAPIARRYRCVPLFIDGPTLWVGLADHDVIAELPDLEVALGTKVAAGFLTELTLNYALDRYYGIRREVRGLQLASVVDAYRWLSDASGRLAHCTTLDEVVMLVDDALTRRFPSANHLVLRVDHDTLVGWQPSGSGSVAPAEVPIDQLRAQSRPLLVGDTLYCVVRDPRQWRAVIRLQGVTPAYGDLELLNVLLESTTNAIGRVKAREEADRGAQLAQSLGRYVPGRVVEELKRDLDTVLFGRKHEVSVLFADMRGFTTLSEHLDPDLTVLMLNTFFSEMSAAITEVGGTLDKFIGDGLMAFWGAPTATPDHATLAVRAAQTMQARMPRVNRKVRRMQIENVDTLMIGIGVCTGTALVGNMGTPQLMQYTAIGDVVNVAARLCGKAAPGEILIDAGTAALVAADVDSELRGPIAMKGRAEPVLVHRVITP